MVVGQEEEEISIDAVAMRAIPKLILEFHSFSPEITTAYDGLRANEASDCLIEMISHSDVLHRFISISRLLSQEK